MKTILLRPKTMEPPFNDRVFEPSPNLRFREYGWYGHKWRCALRDRLAKEGYELKTIDLESPSNADKAIFISMHRDAFFRSCLETKVELVLFEIEFPLGSLGDSNYPTDEYRSKFDRVLTWNESLVDNKRVFKINGPNNWYEGSLADVPFEDRKLCVLAASNKYCSYPLEQYSKRREAILFFQDVCPSEFDLYGVHWDRSAVRYLTRRLPFATYNADGKLRKAEKLLRVDRVIRWFMEEKDYSKCFRGWADNQFYTLSKYRFAIIYECAGGLNGAVSNKIFDCLQAGCIPVYLGAPDISKYVWSDLFIDKREFDYPELLEVMKSFEEFDEWQQKVNTFLSSYDGQRHFEIGWAEEFTEALLRETN